jgi:hypothetical protein
MVRYMKDVVNAMKGGCEMGFGFLFKQIDEASDAVWKAKDGKILYWQNIYHAFACVDFFVAPPDVGMDPGPGTIDIIMFKDSPATPLSKEAVREYGQKKKAQALAWIDGLDDAALAKKHEGFSKRRGMELSNAAVLYGLGGHIMYHVGCNDTMLREKGQSGVF